MAEEVEVVKHVERRTSVGREGNQIGLQTYYVICHSYVMRPTAVAQGLGKASLLYSCSHSFLSHPFSF